jgi:catechol 2,3-dioxygenase-like lactoylglutathione lyase family enzyme
MVVEDRRATVERLVALIGLDSTDVDLIPSEHDTDVATRFAFLTLPGFVLEVIEPVSPEFRAQLLTRGSGADHVCFTVHDLDAAIAAMTEQGARLGHVTPDGPVSTPSFRLAYFDPATTGGLLIELIEPR